MNDYYSWVEMGELFGSAGAPRRRRPYAGMEVPRGIVAKMYGGRG